MAQRDGNFVFVGGTQGIGRATAQAIAAGRASVLLIARDPIAGKAAVGEMRRVGALHADFLAADLSTFAGMKAAADGILAWRGDLHVLMHSAMCAFSRKIITGDGLELAFALQYVARAVIDRLCADALAASGDGRIVHVAGAVPYGLARPDLDDPNFEHRRWGFFKAILPTHVMGSLFLQEAARRWSDRSIGLYAAAVNTTKTRVMQHPDIPLIMRLMAKIGTSPEKSATGAIHLLGATAPPQPRVGIVKPGKLAVETINVPEDEARRLWKLTTAIAQARGVHLPG